MEEKIKIKIKNEQHPLDNTNQTSIHVIGVWDKRRDRKEQAKYLKKILT